MNGSGRGYDLVADGDLALLHRLEERALDLRGRAVDLVREHEVREDGPELGRELARPLVVDDGADEVGGQKIRRELDARELRADRIAHRAHGERLGEPRHALEQHVAAREKPDQDALDHVRLSDDDLADFSEKIVDERALFCDELVQRPDVLHRACAPERLWSAGYSPGWPTKTIAEPALFPLSCSSFCVLGACSSLPDSPRPRRKRNASSVIVVDFVIQLVLGVFLTAKVVGRDMRRSSRERLARAWNPATFWSAIVAFGPLSIPVHFVRTRRSVGGFLLGAAWAAGVLVVLGLASVVVGVIADTFWP